MRKLTAALGIVAPLFYVTAVIVGGLITPGYSHVVHAISELSVHQRPAIETGFWLYNLSLTLFGLGLFTGLRHRSRLLAATGLVLAAVAVAGLLMAWFPMDARDTAPTLVGAIHWVLAFIAALGTMVALVLAGLGFRKWGLRGMAAYSFSSAAIILLSGGVTAAGANLQVHLFGLIERVTIGSFIQWVLGAGVWYWSAGEAPSTLSTQRH